MLGINTQNLVKILMRKFNSKMRLSFTVIFFLNVSRYSTKLSGVLQE